jgi:imidazolonepropionase-like amidohydrolase
MMNAQSPEAFAIVTRAGWFNGISHHAQPCTVVVRAGRIESIAEGDHSAALAAQALPVVRGGYLMPSLIDAHVHLFLDGATTDGTKRSAHMKQSADDLTEAARRSARQSLQYGVTLVRDAGDRHGINNVVREEARNAAAGLCRVRSGGAGIKRAKRYGAFMATDVGGEESIRTSVTELSQHNDEIKLILTGIIDFDAGTVTDEPQFTLEEAQLVVATARAYGRKTFAHCSGAKGLAIAARAGVGSIEHGFFMNRETLAVMRDQQVAWTPTFCPVHFQWACPEAVGWKPETVGNLRRILDNHAEHLRLAHEMGVPLLMGTDAGSMGVEHGKAMLQEIQCYAEAGVPMQAILQSATATNRRHFNLRDPVMQVGSGFEAMLLKQSPFGQMQTLREPLQVWLAT